MKQLFLKAFDGADIGIDVWDEVENAKACVEYFLTNDSIPDTILKRIAAGYPNFTETVNELTGNEYTFEELINNYKSEYLKNRIYSSATILYCSKAFSEIFEYISEPKTQVQQQTASVGRNEPCPCGSGKKYKNCCGKVSV